MKARLIRNESKYTLLKCNGKIEDMCVYAIREFFSTYKDEDLYSGSDWNHETSIEEYPGETIAIVDEEFKLTIIDDEFIKEFLKDSLIGMITSEAYADKYDKNHRQVQKFCNTGRFPIRAKIGNTWYLPENAEYPQHAAIKNKKE